VARNVAGAIAVTEASQAAEGRRLAPWLASNLDFQEDRAGRAGRAALVASELASNLHKHALKGEMLFRRLKTPEGDADGMEILALDKGPGIPDVALSRRDGYSTAGMLGHGLGAVGRQADEIEIYTQPTGTVVAARLWRNAPAPNASRPRYEVGAVHVAIAAESVCGDDWAWRLRDGRLSIFLADGLGHGLLAHEPATAGTRVVNSSHELRPGRLVEEVHAALRPTRGAAVASLAVDLKRRTAAFAGLGNISGVGLHSSGVRHSMVSRNGTAGHMAPRVQEFHYPVPHGAIVVMSSDGLGTPWDLRAYPGPQQRSASVIAAVLYRDFRRNDDVTVVVARERPPVAEKL
jgi:anti-sigma regulatory factor (Ser/Thr protein kinase)